MVMKVMKTGRKVFPSKSKVLNALKGKNTLLILEILFDRLYIPRNQRYMEVLLETVKSTDHR